MKGKVLRTQYPSHIRSSTFLLAETHAKEMNIFISDYKSVDRKLEMRLTSRTAKIAISNVGFRYYLTILDFISDFFSRLIKDFFL